MAEKQTITTEQGRSLTKNWKTLKHNIRMDDIAGALIERPREWEDMKNVHKKESDKTEEFLLKLQRKSPRDFDVFVEALMDHGYAHFFELLARGYKDVQVSPQDLPATVKTLVREVAELKRADEEYKKDRKNQEEKIQKLLAARSDIQAQLERMEELLTEKEIKINKLQGQNESMTRDHNRLKEEKTQAELRLQELERENTVLKEKVEEQELECQRLNTERSILFDSLSKERTTLKDLIDERLKINESITQLISKRNELDREVKALKMKGKGHQSSAFCVLQYSVIVKVTSYQRQNARKLSQQLILTLAASYFINMLLITVVTVLCYMPTRSFGTDCNNEAKFHSNLSIESWCMTGLDDCSLGSLNSSFPTLFDAKGWAPGKPDILNVTSFCQNDSKGNNHAGVHVAWRPPTHSGARDIKGFEIRLEGYMPGYRCSVIQLKENLTQSVIHSVITGSFFPLKRRQNYIIMLFSLPRSDNSGIVSQSYYSPRCENINDKHNWKPKASDFTISYDDERKELNVSFPQPPDHFRFDQFKLTILRVKPYFLAKALINQTFHVFPSVEAGDYQLLLEPFNPKPYDDKLCKCRDDRNQCVTCLTVIKYFAASVRTPSGTNPPVTDEPKWTTKVVIKNVNKTKTKNKTKKDRISSKLMTSVLLPVCLLICLFSIFVAVIFVLRRRRKSRKCCKAGSNFRSSSDLGQADDIHTGKRYIVLVNISDKENLCKKGSYQGELFHILKGMFEQSLTVFIIKGYVKSGKQLRECLNKLLKAQNVSLKESSEKEHDCSETSLIENKATGSMGIKLDCCFKQDKREAALLVCFFVDEHTSTKVLDMCKDVCQAMQSDSMLSETMCVYYNTSNMPSNVANMKKFSYREELPVLLNYIKETLLDVRKTNVSNSSKLTVNMLSDSNDPKTVPRETILTLNKDSDIEGQLINCENSEQPSQGKWLEITKRQRYTSNDSGWGASEHSFRSTPIEEVIGSSSKSSLHSISGTEHDSLSPKSDFSTSIDHSPLRCPSDVYFFPPEDLTSSNSHALGEKSGMENTKIMRIKRGPGSIHKELLNGLKNSEKRQSPSVDSLMNMLKAFNDECSYFMEHEAKPGDVYSVFEGTA